MTSMESHGPVSVDYYHGRPVESITEGDGSEEAPCWTLTLEGGAMIHNFDPTYTIPDQGLVGMYFNASTLSATETTLYFGPPDNPKQVRMSLNPIEYAIVDSEYTKGRLVYAQRSDANMPPVAAHPDERIVEAPLEPEADATNEG